MLTIFISLDSQPKISTAYKFSSTYDKKINGSCSKIKAAALELFYTEPVAISTNGSGKLRADRLGLLQSRFWICPYKISRQLANDKK